MTGHAAAPSPGHRRSGGALKGAGILIRFTLRRDRLRIPVWIASVAGYMILTAAGLPELYATAAERQARAALMSNPATTALAGPGHGLEDYTFGAMLAHELLGFTAIIVALMSILMVVRHTRAEEASGRAELVRAAAVGRHATTAAALTVAVGVNVVLGAIIAAGLGALGIESVTWSGSLLFGASLAAVGVTFAAVALLTAQISEHPRTASGMAGGAIAVAYTLRAAGDMGGGSLSWLSPFGWAQATRAYVDERWWPLLLLLALAAALLVVALRISRHRDVDAGLIRPRPGPATASERLVRPMGLALRIHRTGLIAWGASMFAFGFVYGTLAGEVERFVQDVPALEEFLIEVAGATVLESWFGFLVSFLAMIVGIYAVLATTRLRTEESAGRAEPVLATAVSRSRWVASHLGVVLAGSAALVVVSALGLGIGASLTLGDARWLTSVLGAALGSVPAVWLIVGLTVTLFGSAPRLMGAAWVVVVYALTIGVLGGLLGLPGWVYDLSPFGYLPLLPAEKFALAPVLVLTGIAAALLAAGVAGFRRRDLVMTA